MKKGAPSVNEAGRGGRAKLAAEVAEAVKAAVVAPGSDGVSSHGGAVWQQGATPPIPDRFGPADAHQLIVESAAIATAVRLWLLLVGSPKWSTQRNPSNSADAARCDELVYANLIQRPGLRAAVRRQATKKFLGFAIHAKGWERMADGSLAPSLAWRSQWTVERWSKADDAPWHAAEQRGTSGKVYSIPRASLLYSVEGDLTPEPGGLGVLRHLRETWATLDRYRQLQGIAFDTDVNGVPITRVPYSELERQAKAAGKKTDAEIAEYVAAKVAAFKAFVQNRRRDPKQWLSLDSIPYFGTDTDGSKRPSSVFQWQLEIIKSLIGSIPELRAAMGDLNREIYRLLVAEHVMMGASEGARAVHGDKTDMLVLAVSSLLDDLAEDINRDVVADMVARNGYDVATCAPTVIHEPLSKKSALAVAQMLEHLAKAKLHHADEALAIVRGMDELPPPPEVEEEDGEPEPEPESEEDV